ncbi:MAG: DUF3084 domain-containing protein [Armatimonadetes bacterium]|nr:DUF3084 domain-containing protein [Armatimonadota bacterium]
MRYSVLFVIVLILVSGFIAYFGDLLGRWMGKKRLTILSLRPRHTAYIVTAITGMLISALAVLALVSANVQFKKVLTEGEQILRRNVSLTKINKSLIAKNKSLETRRKELLIQVEQQRKEVDEAREAALKAADAAAKAAQAEAKALKAVEYLKKEISARQQELARLAKERAEAIAEVQLKTKELARLKTELGKLQSAAARATKEAELARVQADEARRQYADAKLRLDKTAADLKQAETKLAEQQKAILEQQEQLKLQQKALIQTGLEKEQYRVLASELLGGDICIRQGDEIARGTISPRQSIFGIRADIYSLLETASEEAIRRGAGIGPNGRAVTVEFRQAISKDYDVRIENESTCVQMAAQAIAQSAFRPEDALVQVICARNSLVGEQVRVKLVLYYNNLVFSKGDKIAETKMDGRLSEGRVLLALINFLQNEVSRAAVSAGIVPVANPDPRATIGSDPGTQVEALMAVVDQIKAKNSKVQVVAYATRDIFAAGPLNMTNMRFSVSKID